MAAAATAVLFVDVKRDMHLCELAHMQRRTRTEAHIHTHTDGEMHHISRKRVDNEVTSQSYCCRFLGFVRIFVQKVQKIQGKMEKDDKNIALD